MAVRRSLALSLALLIALVLVAPAHAQQPTAGQAFDPDTLEASFKDIWFWVTLLTTLVAGAVGGVAFELLALQGSIELPHKPAEDEFDEALPHATVKFVYDLGIWARVILGGVAAVAAMLVLVPTTTFALIATAIVAGMAATAILRSLQDRLLAAVATGETRRVQLAAERQDGKVTEAMAAWTAVKGQLVAASSSPAGAKSLDFGATAPASIAAEDLDKVDRLLSEAHGMVRGS